VNKSLVTLHLRWVVARVILAAVLIRVAPLTSIASQIGRPSPGFFYTPDRHAQARRVDVALLRDEAARDPAHRR